MIEQFQLSERRACRLVGLSRDSFRNPPMASEQTQALRCRIVDIAHQRRRFGYRRVHDLLRRDFPGVNHKRVYRLYREANLAVRKRKKSKRPLNERVPLQLAKAVNEVWSMDFVSDSLSNGRRLKYLTVADDFSHECVDIAVDFGISGELVRQGSRVQGLSRYGENRQRAGVHQQGVHGMGTNTWHSSHLDSTGAPYAKRLYREFQRQVSG